MATSKTTTKTGKKTSKKTAEPAKKIRALKPRKSAVKAASAPAAAPTPEDNLKKFARSTIAATFVKNHNGVWGHEEWLGLLKDLEEKGYMPIDTDAVGMILEEKKVAFFSK